MMQTRTLRVRDANTESEPSPDLHSLPTQYDDAEDVTLRQLGNRNTRRFTNAVLDEVSGEFSASDARLVDVIPDTGDVEFGILLVYPDESLMFVGSDPTAKDAIPLFAFVIDRSDPIPAPATAQEALGLLRPMDVQQALNEEGYLPERQGEWWLTPTDMVPAGTVFRPGVNSRPYGPSPLGNHVPREYGFTTPDSEFVAAFLDEVPNAPSSIEAPPEAIKWSFRQLRKVNPPDGAPDWSDIREFAGDVLVRGTIRHRENDHYIENVGSTWHRASTHNMDVYTGDELISEVHID